MNRLAILAGLVLMSSGCLTVSRNQTVVALLSINSERGTNTTSQQAGETTTAEKVDQDVDAGKTFEDTFNPADSLNPNIDVTPIEWGTVPPPMPARPGPHVREL